MITAIIILILIILLQSMFILAIEYKKHVMLAWLTKRLSFLKKKMPVPLFYQSSNSAKEATERGWANCIQQLQIKKIFVSMETP